MNITQLFPYIATIGAVALFVGFIIAQITTGFLTRGQNVKKEIIDDFKTRIEQLEKQLNQQKIDHAEELKDLEQKNTDQRHDFNNQITTLRLQISKMEGASEEKDKKIAELTAIFQGKDPEMAKLMVEIRGYLKQLMTQGKINQIRNEKIDSDTKQEVGKVLRKK